METTDRIKEYYKSKRISNSLLKSVKNPWLMKLKRDHPEKYEEYGPALKIGSAVDCMLTDPDSWDTNFTVAEVNKPFGLMGKFVEALPPGLTPSSEFSEYEIAYYKSGYKIAMSKVIQSFWDDPYAVKYYITSATPKEVTVLSKDEIESVIKSTDLIRSSPFTRDYFFQSEEHEQLLHQVPIYFTLKDQEFKALLDGIRINHRDRTIEPFDLKTTSKSVYDFPENYLLYGYYTQAALYEIAVMSEGSPVKHLLDEGYTLKNFTFIVVETKVTSTNPPIIYETSHKERHHGLEGGYVNGKYYEGIYQLLDDYLWHEETQLWNYPRSIYLNKGVKPLEVFS